jgi:2-polyprenyl-6-methoxyphenol hydroxylase-like FAD-dependent oxidoreductase
MLEEDSEDFRDAFTDVVGKRHFTTIPRGKMQPRIWAKRQERRAALLAPLAELLQLTSDPFISAIRELAAPRSVFHDGKLLLVGDAFTLFRPHTASATNLAARQALGLGDLLRGQSNLGEWEKSSLEYAARINALGIAYAEYCFTGKIPDSLSAAIQPGDQYKI